MSQQNSNCSKLQQIAVKFLYQSLTTNHIETHVRQFQIHGSVHRDSILIRSNEMQQYSGVYLLQNYSTSFGCLSHPSSGVHQTVTPTSDTDHSFRTTTFRHSGLIRARWR